MTESNPGNQKLTVVGSSDGGYIVNSYYKVSDQRVADLPAVIDYMCGLSPKVLEAVPTYAYLSESDQSLIEAVRSALIKRDEYWINVASVLINPHPDNSHGIGRTRRQRTS